MMQPKKIPATRFAFADHAMVERHPEGGYIASTIDGRAFHMTDEQLERRGLSIDCPYGEEGFYAIMDSFRDHATFSYRVDYSAGLVFLENGPWPMTIHDFMTAAVRVDDNGLPICSFCDSAQNQLGATTRNGLARAHMGELIDGNMAYGSSLVTDWIEASAFRKYGQNVQEQQHMACVA